MSGLPNEPLPPAGPSVPYTPSQPQPAAAPSTTDLTTVNANPATGQVQQVRREDIPVGEHVPPSNRAADLSTAVSPMLKSAVARKKENAKFFHYLNTLDETLHHQVPRDVLRIVVQYAYSNKGIMPKDVEEFQRWIDSQDLPDAQKTNLWRGFASGLGIVINDPDINQQQIIDGIKKAIAIPIKGLANNLKARNPDLQKFIDSMGEKPLFAQATDLDSWLRENGAKINFERGRLRLLSQGASAGEGNWQVFPSAICHLTRVTELAMSQHNFNLIPSEIGNLVNLRILSITECSSVTELPDEITLLTHLESLIVYDDGLLSLPQDLGILPKLTVFDAANNQLSSVPNSLFARIVEGTIERVGLSGNNLDEEQVERITQAAKASGKTKVDL